MKLLPLTLIASLSLGGLAYGAGALPTYDDINYTVGVDPDDQTPPASANGFDWTGILGAVAAARTPAITVTSDNLSYPGLATSTGNALLATGPNSQGLRYFAGANVIAGDNTIYYSVLFKITDLGTLTTTTPRLLFAMNNASTLDQAADPTTQPGRTFVRLSTTPGKFNVGIRTGYGSGVAAATWSPQEFSPGDTVFVVFRYLFTSTTVSSSVALVNPSPNDLGSATIQLGTATTPSYALSNYNSSASSAFGTIQSLMIVPTNNLLATVVIDEVRMGSTFASVAPAGPPGFMTPMPASQSVNYGETLVLNPGAGGPGTLSFQWKKNGSDLSDGNGFSGTTTGVLSITNAVAGQAGSYTLTVTSTPYGSADSTACVVSVADPAITGQPSPLTLPPGANAAFSVVAAGSGTVTYQWKKDGTDLSNGAQGSGSTVAGATTANLAVNNIAPGDAGTYTVLVSGTGPAVLSSNALLTVVDPAITSEPTSLTVDYTTNALFSVTVAGTGPFSYQWQTNGVELTDGVKYPGYNSANLTVNGATYLDAGSYQVFVTNNLGNWVGSAVAVLTVNDPIIVTQPAPASQIKVAGESVSFNVVAAGSGTLTYQWKRVVGAVTNTLVDSTYTNGATTATLTLDNLIAGESGSYFVVVSGDSGQLATSAQAALTVVAPPVIAPPMQPRTVLAGSRVVLAAGVSGTSPLTYTWTKDGGSPLAVPQTNYLNLADVALTDAGSYTLVVSNYAGKATNSATLSVQSAPVLLMLTNLAVLRVGDGGQTLALSGNSVYVDQFTPAGQYVNTVTIPDSGDNAFLMTGGGSTFTDAQITRSGDGTLLSLAGYATNLTYGVTLQGSASTVIPRAIYTVDAAGNAVLAKVANNYYGNNIFRSAATDGAGNFWGTSGNSGTRYFGNEAIPAANIQTGVTNTRVIAVFNGDLWFSEAQAGDQSLWKFSGLPTTAATPTKIVDVTGGTGTPSPMAFSVSPDGFAIYVADDRPTSSGGISRYDYDDGSSSWVASYTIGTGVANIGARGLTVDWSNPAAPVIYATTAEESTQNRIISITDTNTVLSEVVTLATSGQKQFYRSIVFNPILMPSLTVSSTPSQVTLEWLANTTWTLQSKTNLTDVAWDTVNDTPSVNNGTYSVTLSKDSASKFFRLQLP